MDTADILKLVAAILAPIVSAVFAFAREMLERRRVTGIIAAAKSQVEVWKAIAEVQSLVLKGDALEKAQALVGQQLGRIVERVQAADATRQPSPKYPRPKERWRRVLFCYPPPSRWIWIPRAYFYGCLFVPPFTYSYMFFRMREDELGLWSGLVASQVVFGIFVYALVVFTENRVAARQQSRIALPGDSSGIPAA